MLNRLRAKLLFDEGKVHEIFVMKGNQSKSEKRQKQIIEIFESH
jgi:hypothetical protein